MGRHRQNDGQHGACTADLTDGTRKTIQGLVIPVAWDGDSAARAVSICTDDEEEFFVRLDSLSLGLIDCLRAVIRAEVTVLGFVDGRLRVQVHRFEVLRRSYP